LKSETVSGDSRVFAFGQPSFDCRALRQSLFDAQTLRAALRAEILYDLLGITTMTFAFFRPGIAAALSVMILMTALVAAEPSSINIVAVGASNTSGLGVNSQDAYPARLQRMLKERGYNVQVANAGVVLDTTAGMLRRIDSAVPDGTKIVIVQPGGNDLRFFRTREQRAENIDAMVKRLRARNIKVIVFDPVIPPQYYQWDGIHINAEGHAMFAAKLLPQVMTAIKHSR
jgi:acyl-CoA thioesterase-1